MVDTAIEVVRTETFNRWLTRIKDRATVVRILQRVDRLALGNPGDVRSVGAGVAELKIDHGPGYRVYFSRHGRQLVLLLCGGDKSTQTKDIRTALRMAAEWRSE